jgi:hypothetical protein
MSRGPEVAAVRTLAWISVASGVLREKSTIAVLQPFLGRTELRTTHDF